MYSFLLFFCHFDKRIPKKSPKTSKTLAKSAFDFSNSDFFFHVIFVQHHKCVRKQENINKHFPLLGFLFPSQIHSVHNWRIIQLSITY